MPTVGPFRMINHRFAVRCPDTATAELVAGTLASVRAPGGAVHDRYAIHAHGPGSAPATSTTPATSTAPAQPARYDVMINGRMLRGASDHHGVIDAICTEANRVAIHTSAAPAVLHAGAVERDGRAVVIAGRSGAGKSTLVTRLLRGGWRYLTDEGAQLTADLMVLPYLKPIVGKGVTVRVDGVEVAVARHHLDPTVLGEVCPTPTPVIGLMLLGTAPSTRGGQLVDACQLAFPVGSARTCLDVLAALVARRPVVCLPARPSTALVGQALTELLAVTTHAAGRSADTLPAAMDD